MELAATILSPYFLLACLLVILLWALLMVFLERHVWTPLRIQKGLKDQGICGPPFRPIVGSFSEIVAAHVAANSLTLPLDTHNIIPKVFPFYAPWSAKYGKSFVFWMGAKPMVVLNDAELCKEILYGKNGEYPKGFFWRPDVVDFLKDGLAMLEGEQWSYHRRMLNPAFYIEKLKASTPWLTDLAAKMLDRWQQQLESAKDKKSVEVDASKDFMSLTVDVMAHTVFGSSYEEGKKVFQLQQELQDQVLGKLLRSLYIPGSRFLPTAINRKHWRLTKQIDRLIDDIIHERLEASERNQTSNFGDDLLGVMLSAFKADPSEELKGRYNSVKKITLQDITRECIMFFFAGHETTSALLTWTSMLLSVYPEWQERAREEVMNLVGPTARPDAQAVSHMKVVGMILNEVLRLYPPIIALLRDAPVNMKLGDLIIPAGTSFMIPIPALHTDPDLWGADCYEFKPQRFANGVVNACKHPTAFLPFSQGPRNCVGQNFALLEAKIATCMILQRFRLRLSPGYRHSPATIISLQTEHGMQILVEAI